MADFKISRRMVSEADCPLSGGNLPIQLDDRSWDHGDNSISSEGD